MKNTEQTNKTDFIIIGAGFGGLAMAIKLLKIQKKSFIILEKASEIGGTWRDNTYPGCACDIPSHLYSFSFAPNPNWSRMYSPQPEIFQYLKDCVAQYQLRSYIQFNSEVVKMEFDEQKGEWNVLTKNGQCFQTKYVICALGPLNRPNIPIFEGLENFKGKVFHSSDWDYDYALKGKNVAVIGTGASAIQFIPQIAKEVEKLYIFQRTPPWIVPKLDRKITWFERKLFKTFPFFQFLQRTWIYWLNELKGLSFVGNEAFNKKATKLALKHIQKTIQNPSLQEAVTPPYKFGCKRVLISNDYYPTLQLPNVSLITKSIQKIENESVVDIEESKYPIDTIIFGTGFVASEFFVNLKIYGRNGRELFEEWSKKGAEAYRGIQVSGFPNLMFLVGPNTGLGHNSIIHMIESQINFILDFMKLNEKLPSEAFLDLKPEIQAKFNAQIQKQMENTVWSSGCKSWYLNTQGKNTTLWPRLTYTYRKLTKQCNEDDYELCAYNAKQMQSVE